MTAIARPDASEHAPYYAKYIEKVPAGDLLAILERQRQDVAALVKSIPEAKGGHRYAPGKWSIKEVMGHVIDTERIFSYRAMRIARGDQTPLPGFEQNPYVTAGKFDARPLAESAAEFDAVRRATQALFASLDAEALARRGTASGNPVTTRAIAYIVAGHVQHHMDILTERYLK
jgi:uncharacterized damage-inducible protein DinB